MAIREILTDWQVPNGSVGTSVMYCDSAVSLADCRLAVFTLWEGLKTLFPNTVTATVRQESRLIDEATGTLIGVGADATVRVTTGTGANADVVPGASQLLLRWTTGEVVGGRRINGRTYVPGISESSNVVGQMASTATAGAAAQTYADNAAPVIWHRPNPVTGASGSRHSLLSGTAWTEWAVLRRRRA